MKTLISIAAVATAIAFTPVPSSAQGVEVGVPGVAGVRIGDPGYRRYHDRYDRHYDRPGFVDREVRYSRGCRTVTIERPDGSIKRIRRCG